MVRHFRSVRRPSRVRSVMLLLTATLTVSVAAACGDDSNDLPPPPATPPGTGAATPGLDLTAEEEQAVAEAQATFDDFMTAYIEVSTADLPSPEEAEDLFFQVERHAEGSLPQDLRTEVIGRWAEGQIASGQLDWAFVGVASVDMANEINDELIPRVDLLYCINATNWVPVDANTGEPAAATGRTALWQYAIGWHNDWGGLGEEGWRVIERNEETEGC